MWDGMRMRRYSCQHTAVYQLWQKQQVTANTERAVLYVFKSFLCHKALGNGNICGGALWEMMQTICIQTSIFITSRQFICINAIELTRRAVYLCLLPERPACVTLVCSSPPALHLNFPPVDWVGTSHLHIHTHMCSKRRRYNIATENHQFRLSLSSSSGVYHLCTLTFYQPMDASSLSFPLIGSSVLTLSRTWHPDRWQTHNSAFTMPRMLLVFLTYNDKDTHTHSYYATGISFYSYQRLGSSRIDWSVQKLSSLTTGLIILASGCLSVFQSPPALFTKITVQIMSQCKLESGKSAA